MLDFICLEEVGAMNAQTEGQEGAVADVSDSSAMELLL